MLCRLVLLTHDSARARLIANALAERVGLLAIAIESSARRPRGAIPRPLSLKKAAKWLLSPTGYDRVARFQRFAQRSAIERRVLGFERRLARRADAEFEERSMGRGRTWPAGVPIASFPSLNDAACIQWLRGFGEPELGVVWATGILRPPIIALPRRGILNPHTALLPDYRGTRAEFWQVLHGRLDRAGVTVHFVDEGIDTGDIVVQRAASVPPTIDPYMLRVANTFLTAELLPEAIEWVVKGTAKGQPQGAPSTPTYRARDITLDRRIELLRKLGCPLP